MRKKKLALMCFIFSFLVSILFIATAKAQTNKISEAKRWGFHGINEDFFSAEKEEKWGWHEDTESVKRFVSAIWANVANTWDKLWGGLKAVKISLNRDLNHNIIHDTIVDDLYQTGLDYYQKGEFDKAKREWRKILMIDSGNREAKLAIKNLYK